MHHTKPYECERSMHGDLPLCVTAARYEVIRAGEARHSIQGERQGQLGEILMPERSLCADALVWVVRQQAVEQVHACCGQMREFLL